MADKVDVSPEKQFELDMEKLQLSFKKRSTDKQYGIALAEITRLRKSCMNKKQPPKNGCYFPIKKAPLEVLSDGYSRLKLLYTCRLFTRPVEGSPPFK